MSQPKRSSQPKQKKFESTKSGECLSLIGQSKLEKLYESTKKIESTKTKKD
jgi:hypothetical protein